MNWPGQDRWLHLWQSAGLGGDAAQWYEKLTQAYAEPQRHYHNQQHLSECLAEFDGAKHLAQDPAAVELALWFHDAVYDPKAGDNEERSAAMAVRCIEAGGQPKLAAAVSSLVMATKTHTTEAGPDAGLLVDVDLSILGKDEQRFARNIAGWPGWCSNRSAPRFSSVSSTESGSTQRTCSRRSMRRPRGATWRTQSEN